MSNGTQKSANDLEQRSERAHDLARRTTYRLNHDEEWRNLLAVELNHILSRVEYEMATCLPPDEHDVAFAEAALSVVKRVADSESIKRVADFE